MIFMYEEIPYKYAIDLESSDLLCLEVWKGDKFIYIDLIPIKQNGIQWAAWHLRDDEPLISKTAINYFNKLYKNLAFL